MKASTQARPTLSRRTFIQATGATLATTGLLKDESARAEGLPAAAGGTIKIGEFEVNRMGYGAMWLTGDGIFGPPEAVATNAQGSRTASSVHITTW